MNPLAPDSLAAGLTTAPLAWGLVVCLVAIGYLFREIQKQRDKADAASTGARDQLLTFIKDSAREQRELVQQLLAISERMNRGVEVFDRFRTGSRSVIRSLNEQAQEIPTSIAKGYADENER